MTREPVLAWAEWVVLAEGNQGSVRKAARRLDEAVRSSGVFELVNQFQRPKGGLFPLAAPVNGAHCKPILTERFQTLPPPGGRARGAGSGVRSGGAGAHARWPFQLSRPGAFRGPGGLGPGSEAVKPRWTLALLAVLENRPAQASEQFEALQRLLPDNPWPAAYRSVVNLAGWNPWQAAAAADGASVSIPCLRPLEIWRGAVGAVWRIPAAMTSVPSAVTAVEKALEPASNQKPD